MVAPSGWVTGQVRPTELMADSTNCDESAMPATMVQATARPWARRAPRHRETAGSVEAAEMVILGGLRGALPVRSEPVHVAMIGEVQCAVRAGKHVHAARRCHAGLTGARAISTTTSGGTAIWAARRMGVFLPWRSGANIVGSIR